MAYEIDPEGVSAVRGRLAGEPAELRAAARDLTAAVVLARAGGLGEAARLVAALDRFGALQSAALDALADGAAALGGHLDLVSAGARAAEDAMAAAFAGAVR